MISPKNPIVARRILEGFIEKQILSYLKEQANVSEENLPGTDTELIINFVDFLHDLNEI